MSKGAHGRQVDTKMLCDGDDHRPQLVGSDVGRTSVEDGMCDYIGVVQSSVNRKILGVDVLNQTSRRIERDVSRLLVFLVRHRIA